MTEWRKMRKFPLSDFTEPKTGAFHIFCDQWWPVTENDEIYFFGTQHSPYCSPQTNANPLIVRRVANNSIITAAGGYAEVRQIPVVYVPINWSDYDH